MRPDQATTRGSRGGTRRRAHALTAATQQALLPQAFSSAPAAAGAQLYLREPLVRELVTFFERKGLSAIKEEDRREQWYEDWLAWQTAHELYARLLSPRPYSRLGSAFDLLRYTRFLEVCAYFSPAHGYSLQVTFLGLFAILMGSNAELKREAVAALEAGGLLAFGVSERGHGSDLLGNEFTVTPVALADQTAKNERFVANGSKYYIGNANCAAMIAILAKRDDPRAAGHARRAPFVLFAMRPGESEGFQEARKIHTLGVRSAFVGEFEVKNHEFCQADVAAEGRQAWDAVFGTVTLGKFFLGFGSIGICERALDEAAAHLGGRMLYGKPAIQMPHLRHTVSLVYARLTAMKLYAYRALDYVHVAREADRRYLLFAAVQKAKVSTEGVQVMALLGECMGAKAFEADTYFEMALRDVQLIPGLEGSAHINLGLAVQFIPRYFANPDPALLEPASLLAADARDNENPYLLEARTGAVHAVAFPGFLRAYRPLMNIAGVRSFAAAAKAFQLLARRRPVERTARADTPATLALGQCFATIAYAQLIAENSRLVDLPAPMVSAIFHTLLLDLSAAVLTLASHLEPGAIPAALFRRLVCVPETPAAVWDFVSEQFAAAPAAGRDRRAE